MRASCTTRPITMAAMMGNGMIGVCSAMMDLSQSGALPPGEGKMSTAMPSQTKERPKVTTMEGRLRL